MSAAPSILAWRSAIRDDTGLRPTTKLVLLILATHADGEGDNIYPSRSLLAHECGFDSCKPVDRALREATAYVKIIRRRRPGKQAFTSSRYTLTLPKGRDATDPRDATATTDLGTPESPRRDARDTRVGTPGQQEVVHRSSSPKSIPTEVHYEGTGGNTFGNLDPNDILAQALRQAATREDEPLAFATTEDDTPW